MSSLSFATWKKNRTIKIWLKLKSYSSVSVWNKLDVSHFLRNKVYTIWSFYISSKSVILLRKFEHNLLSKNIFELQYCHMKLISAACLNLIDKNYCMCIIAQILSNELTPTRMFFAWTIQFVMDISPLIFATLINIENNLVVVCAMICS